MKTRPWPLVILALCQIFSPVVSVAVSAWSQHIPLTTFSGLIAANASLFTLFKIFGLPLIAGVAIFAVKRWSYPVFLTTMGWVMVDNVLVALSSHGSFGIFTLVCVYAVNIACVAYFLMPTVSAAYFNPRLRWWESKPRYRVNFTGEAVFTQGRDRALIADISQGGLLLQIHNAVRLNMGDSLVVRFSFFNLNLELQGKVVHSLSRGNFQAYGVNFFQLSSAQKTTVKALITSLQKLGFRERQDRVALLADLKLWFKRVTTTGKGLVPELPGNYKNSESTSGTTVATSTTTLVALSTKPETDDKSSAA